MKFFTKKSTVQKIVLVIIIILLFNFTLAPYQVFADDDDDGGWGIGGTLVKEVFGLLAWICDIIMGGLNNFMLGANGFGSAMLSLDDPNLEEGSGSWLYVNPDDVDESDPRTIVFENNEINTRLIQWFGGQDYSIPNMLYSPENIFANNIAALDVNFLRANEYQSIYQGGKEKFRENADEKSVSAAQTLKETIASWYKSFRNIAIVGLMSVLIYLGIRIVICSTAADKAKYKENLKDWFVALCLVFVIHFFMSAILMVTDKITQLFATSVNDGYVIYEKDKGKAFNTNLTGLIRFQVQSNKASTSAVYTILYIAIVIYTCMFTIIYLKRFLYMAFFTMIAPLVALTYPIDRAGDRTSPSF